MKILATKNEMAHLVRECAMNSMCSSCVFGRFCGSSYSEGEIEDFIEIVEDSGNDGV